METEAILFILTIVIGFYMAWNIGANDVSNAISTSVGAGSLSLRKAVMIAAVLEFAGAFFAGSHVSETVQRGIVDFSVFSDHPLILVYGMVASLLASGVWLQIASFYGLPVSTTHSIVGAIMGFGIAYGGVNAVYWDTIASIAMSWVVSPFLGAALSYAIFTLVMKRIFHSRNPIRVTKRCMPYLVFLMVVILSLVMCFNGLKNLNMNLSFIEALGISMLLGVLGAYISKVLISKKYVEPLDCDSSESDVYVLGQMKKALRHMGQAHNKAGDEVKYHIENLADEMACIVKSHSKKDDIRSDSTDYLVVEKIFSYLQMMSVCCIAFAHGANDVANAIGPLAAVVGLLKTGDVTVDCGIPLWVLLMGGSGIVIGLATWGWRVVETIGKHITELTPSRGFAAELGAATTILVASKMGLPISTTHTLVGAVLGVGLARGFGALNLNTIKDIVISWVVTVPAGALLSVTFFFILNAIFGG
jgi:inorganic phosphate transporter, PiT family